MLELGLPDGNRRAQRHDTRMAPPKHKSSPRDQKWCVWWQHACARFLNPVGPEPNIFSAARTCAHERQARARPSAQFSIAPGRKPTLPAARRLHRLWPSPAAACRHMPPPAASGRLPEGCTPEVRPHAPRPPAIAGPSPCAHGDARARAFIASPRFGSRKTRHRSFPMSGTLQIRQKGLAASASGHGGDRPVNTHARACGRRQQRRARDSCGGAVARADGDWTEASLRSSPPSPPSPPQLPKGAPSARGRRKRCVSAREAYGPEPTPWRTGANGSAHGLTRRVR